ncbi:MAG: hypothetical protein M3N28_06140 [Actinomycetota bacterium]|nr:hypothetical protein [Actinomycetota bacterium]
MTPRRDLGELLLEEVLADVLQDGQVELAPLVSAAQHAEVDAGVFADEEIHLMRGQIDDRPDEFIDAPRLGQLSEHDQDVALETALWLLQAQGAATWDDSREAFEFVGPYAIVGELRHEPEAAVSVRVDVRGEGTRRAAIYRVRPDLFLTEDVSEVGLHHFVFRSAPSAATWLAGLVDPLSRAKGSAHEQRARTAADLNPNLDQLTARCESSALVFYGARSPDGSSAQRAFTCYSGNDGVYVLWGWQSASSGEAVLYRLGPGDLIGFCLGFLARLEGDGAP